MMLSGYPISGAPISGLGGPGDQEIIAVPFEFSAGMAFLIDTIIVAVPFELTPGIYGTVDQVAAAEPLSVGFGLSLTGVGVMATAPEFQFALSADTSGFIFFIQATPAEISFGIDVAGTAMFSTAAAIIRYYLTITGAPDGLSDIEIPMSSFQARRRSGDPTYLSVVIPSADFAAAIAARPNGSIRIDQGYVQGGSILQREPIMEAPISDAAVYQGGRQSSIVLTGYGTTTFTPKAVTLTNAVYRSVTGGKIHYRLARPYIFLNPGDTVTIEDDTFVIGTMSYAISPAQQQIELQEA